MTSGEHERSGGVRGAINDLLGLGERRGERDRDGVATPDPRPGPNADQPFGDDVRGDRRDDQVAADQRIPDQHIPDQRLGDQNYGDQNYGERYGDGATAATTDQVDDPAAVHTDRFDTPPGDHAAAADDRSRASGQGGLFEPADGARGETDGTGTPVTPHGATGGVAGQPGVNPDVPAQARLDAPPPGLAGPRHELLGQEDGSAPGAVPQEQVYGEHDRPVDQDAHDDASVGAGTAGTAGATATTQHTGDHGDGTAIGHPADGFGPAAPGSASTGTSGDTATAGVGSPASVDTATTGGASPAPAGTATAGGGSPASAGTDDEGRERLVPAQRASEYGTRWDQIKGDFVDEPRRAVAGADTLVGELLDELQSLFAQQRHGLDKGLDADETSTEDLRLALRRYRSFFDRLLSI